MEIQFIEFRNLSCRHADRQQENANFDWQESVGEENYNKLPKWS